jgi:undecaprenyl-diphosphatase
VTGWNVLCTVFSPVTFRVLTLGLVVAALMRRSYRRALFLFLSVELSAVLTEIAKRLADRPRPATAMVHALGASFPSGHAVGTMVAVLALGVVMAPRLRPAVRTWAIAAGILVVVLVGVGRVALNVHHPSDVLAGWALGYVYVVLCLPVLREPRVATSAGTPEAPGSGR